MALFSPLALSLRSWLFGLLMAVFSLPALNHELGIIKSDELKGDVHLAPDTVFTLPTWLNGTYQQKKEAYLNDNTGLHADMVRFNNQLDYYAFGKFHASGVVEGKKHYLFEMPYISTLRGDDFLGDSIIHSQLGRLRYIQDTLQRAGKQILVALAPSKARFYSEYIPDNLKPTNPAKPTNYEVMRAVMQEKGISFIDLNAWYLSQKEAHPNRLFSKSGTHWSYYGADLAADTLHRKMETMLKIDIPDIKIVKTDCDQPAHGSDIDIANGTNLIWPYSNEKMCYNTLEIKDIPGKTHKPNVIYISDSFFWLLMYDYIPHGCYNNWQAWFYFQQAWGGIQGNQSINQVNLSDFNWVAEIFKSDIVVLLFTEANLYRLGAGFIDAAYEKLQPHKN